MRQRYHVLLCCWLAVGVRPAIGQSDPRAVQPLRVTPVEKVTVKLGVRDLGPAVLAGGMLYVGGPTGRGGLFAVNESTGKLRWTFRPTGLYGGSGAGSDRPALVGALVIAPFGGENGAVIAVSAVTGKEVWRAVGASAHSAVVSEGERVFLVTKDCKLVALAAGSGNELWTMPLRFVDAGACTTTPVVRDGTVYAQIMARAPEGTAAWPYARYIAAFDAATGLERWRHRPLHPEYRQGAEPHTPVVTESAVYFAGENALYALDRATGRPLFAPVFLMRVINGRERNAALNGMIDGGSTLIAATEVSLISFDKGSGRIVWELPGRFSPDRLSVAVASPVLYFQGALDGAPDFPGTLHALDMSTGTRLWSFTRRTTDPKWNFGAILPVDGGLWVDGYAALLKLRAP